jgi:alpha/beta superfamily hydrolase
MQLLMRRPEISGFISIAPLAKHYDFSFLAPCPASGLFVNGERDSVTSPEAVNGLVTKLKTQRGITIEHKVIPGANHFFQDKIDDLVGVCGDYLDRRLALES